MAWDHYKVFKGLLIIIKHVMWPVSIGIGIHVLTSISSGAHGFKFLGIIAISIGVMLLILFCVDCATFDNAEEVFLFESICCAVPLYLLMVGLGLFALVVSSHGSGKSIPGIAYKEYELSSYSKWLQNKVNDTHDWERYYKRILIKHHVCGDMVTIYSLDTLEMFHQRPLNSFESGCCKPPEECSMKYTSPTIWTMQENQNYSNMDCHKWSNGPNALCFDCQSCKAAFAQDVKHHWVLPGVLIVVVVAKLVLGTLVYILCCCFNPNMK